MGVDIRTIISDNVATRCDGCNEIIEGTPWRVNVLDIVATESPVDWTEAPLVNARDATRTLQVTLAIAQAARSGTEVATSSESPRPG